MTPLVLLSIPGLRRADLQWMPNLRAMTSGGSLASLTPSFPAVTCSVQTNMTTGCRPRTHGIIGNGMFLHEELPFDRSFMYRDSLLPDTVRGELRHDPCNDFPVWPRQDRLPYVEMWTMPNMAVEAPQIWEHLHEQKRRSSVWFALMSKFCAADSICNFAPIHHPDGSESLWCYTRPYLLYGELRDRLGHFPVHHYWGPQAGLPATQWIARAAVFEANRSKNDFFYVYLPRLDYSPQKFGPDAPELIEDLRELDTVLEELRTGFTQAYQQEPTWLIAGEYAFTAVDSVVYPNRILRELGLLGLEERDSREYLLPGRGKSFALCDHQFSHIYINDNDPALAARIAARFREEPGIEEVLLGPDELARYELDHPRSGQIVLISRPDSWQSYYYWEDDTRAPDFARNVDIHRKPGYDPVEMFFDPKTRSVPLDATLIKGSHGAPARNESQKTILLSNNETLFETDSTINDIDVYSIIKNFFER